MKIIANPLLTEGPFEDWSQVRSPSRAARRRKQGHPQRIRFYWKPSEKVYCMGDVLVCHPVIYATVKSIAQPCSPTPITGDQTDD